MIETYLNSGSIIFAMKVYLVGHSGPEHNLIISVHRTREGALKAWNRIRINLKREAAEGYAYWKPKGESVSIYEGMIKNLSCKDPALINNYPWETPYIDERELED